MCGNILCVCRKSNQRTCPDQACSAFRVASSSLLLIERGKREPTIATLEARLIATRHNLVPIPTVSSDAARIAADIGRELASRDDLGESITRETHRRSDASSSSPTTS